MPLLSISSVPLSMVRRLQPTLRHFTNSFSLYVVSAPPGLRHHVITTLATSSTIITPFGVDTFALTQLPGLVGAVRAIRSQCGPRLGFLNCLPGLIGDQSPRRVSTLPNLHRTCKSSVFTRRVVCQPYVGGTLTTNGPI